MTILEIAIEKEGGPARLARKLQVHRNNITNWRARGLPRGYQLALTQLYAPAPQAKRKKTAA